MAPIRERIQENIANLAFFRKVCYGIDVCLKMLGETLSKSPSDADD